MVSTKTKTFSRTWVRSKDPSKQRKYRYRAPIHIKRKFLSAHLSKTLREKYKTRSIPIRKGDEVIVVRGDFKGKKAKVERVEVKKTKVYLSGVTRKRKDGTVVHIGLDPSNLMITSLNLDDKKRVKSLERKIGKK